MKKLFITIIAIISVAAFAQSMSEPGTMPNVKKYKAKPVATTTNFQAALGLMKNMQAKGLECKMGYEKRKTPAPVATQRQRTVRSNLTYQ